MKRRRLLLILLLGCVAFAGLCWLIFHSHDSTFHGKPESEWIKGINYFGDDAQLKQWRSFGPEGLHLLARALDDGRLYRKSYRWLMPRLPGSLNSFLYPRLPKPADSHSQRMCVASLLRQFGKDSKPVEPAIARALDDDDAGVRLIAIGCYDELLEVMTVKEKAARLPEFLRSMQDRDEGIRNNAAVVLYHYPEQAPVVVPVLTNGLQDTRLPARLMVAKALVHIDPDAADKAGIVPILIDILHSSNNQVAYQAAESLGVLGKQPELAVPALISAVQGTDSLVATYSTLALGRFPKQADIIFPVLLDAYRDTNSIVRRWASASALKAINPAAATKAEVK